MVCGIIVYVMLCMVKYQVSACVCVCVPQRNKRTVLSN